MNLLANLTPENFSASGLTWESSPLAWASLPGGGIQVTVPPRVDYFQDPAGKMSQDNAPYLWLEVSGDFIAQAHVRPGFNTTYDAGALMVRQDTHHWAKLCYESTDFGTTAAVSVVTNQVSDDANGVNLTSPDLWLQIIRQGDVFGMHYSLDGKDWRMVRLFRLQLQEKVKVGLVAQCPIGPGTSIDFLSFSIRKASVKDLRAGL
jgi:uncharacterized protein